MQHNYDEFCIAFLRFISSVQLENHCSELSKQCCLSIHTHFSHPPLIYAVILIRPIILSSIFQNFVLIFLYISFLPRSDSSSFLAVTHLTVPQNSLGILPPLGSIPFFPLLMHTVLSLPLPFPVSLPVSDNLSITILYCLLFCVRITPVSPIRFKHFKGNLCISVFSATARTMVR